MASPLGELFKTRTESQGLPTMGKVMSQSMGPQEQEQAETDPLFAAMLGRVQRVSAEETGHTTFNEFFKERVSARDLLADAFAGFAAQSVGQKHLGLRDQLFGEFQQERALNQQKQQFQQKLALDLAQTHQRAIDQAEQRRLQAMREGRMVKAEDQIAELRALQIEALDQKIKYAENQDEREAAQKTKELQLKRLLDMEKRFVGAFKTPHAKSFIDLSFTERQGDFASRAALGSLEELREQAIAIEEAALKKEAARKAGAKTDPPANPVMVRELQNQFREGATYNDASKFADKATIAEAVTSFEKPIYLVPTDVRKEISDTFLNDQLFTTMKDLVLASRGGDPKQLETSGFWNRLQGFYHNLEGRFGEDTAANVLEGLTGIAATRAAKTIGGDTGRLSDQDRETAAKSLSQIGSSTDELRLKTQILQGIAIQRAFSAVTSRNTIGGKPEVVEVMSPEKARFMIFEKLRKGEVTNLTDAVVEFANSGFGIK